MTDMNKYYRHKSGISAVANITLQRKGKHKQKKKETRKKKLLRQKIFVFGHPAKKETRRTGIKLC